MGLFWLKTNFFQKDFSTYLVSFLTNFYQNKKDQVLFELHQKWRLFYRWQLRKRIHFWCSSNKCLVLLILSELYKKSRNGIFPRSTNLVHIRWVSVVEFHYQALCIGKVFGQESTVVKWNYQILSLHLVTDRQKVPILDFQSEFSMSKIIRIFLKKIFIEEYQFKRTFFVKIIFCWLQFQNHFITKMTPNFWWTVTWWRPKIC